MDHHQNPPPYGFLFSLLGSPTTWLLAFSPQYEFLHYLPFPVVEDKTRGNKGERKPSSQKLDTHKNPSNCTRISSFCKVSASFGASFPVKRMLLACCVITLHPGLQSTTHPTNHNSSDFWCYLWSAPLSPFFPIPSFLDPPLKPLAPDLLIPRFLGSALLIALSVCFPDAARHRKLGKDIDTSTSALAPSSLVLNAPG